MILRIRVVYETLQLGLIRMFDSLPVLRSVSQLRSRVRSWRAFGETIAIAPMSGGLHEGHLSVIREARRRADRVLAAVFIDPVGLDEDAEVGDYTDAEAADTVLLEGEDCDAIYAPAFSVLLPPEFTTDIHLDDLTEVLSGKDDPARFDGYIRSMARLLNQAQADYLFFGERNWQKLTILRTLAEDLSLPTEVIGVETERDMDGVPFSTAAAGLDPAARAIAVLFSRDLQAAAREIAGGAPADKTIARVSTALAGAGAEIEHVDLLDAANLAMPTPGCNARLFGAIRVCGARLTDNCPVKIPT